MRVGFDPRLTPTPNGPGVTEAGVGAGVLVVLPATMGGPKASSIIEALLPISRAYDACARGGGSSRIVSTTEGRGAVVVGSSTISRSAIVRGKARSRGHPNSAVSKSVLR